MTLDEAGRRQAAWKTKHGAKICKHERMVDNLISKKGRNTGYVVCMECGEVFVDPGKQLSPAKIKKLKELLAQDR